MEETTVEKRIYPKKKIALAVVLIVALVGVSAVFAAIQGSGSDDLVVQGSVKMTETTLNSKLAGVIEEVYVTEGDFVQEGDVLVKLDSSTVEAKLQQAEGAKSAAEAQAQLAQSGARNQEVAQAKAAYDYAAKTYERMQALLAEEAISQATFDQVEAQYIAAKETYNMAVEGARAEDKAAARALVEQADGAVAEVNSYLEDSVIKAPTDGIVTALNVNAKELISTGMPLATVTNTKDAWVEVNVKETELGKVHRGSEAELTFAAYEGRSFTGSVANVSQTPDFATKRATNENGDFDVKSYGVKIKLPQMDVDLYAGMTVMVNFGNGADGTGN